jgi:diaminopimelate decarboxylase
MSLSHEEIIDLSDNYGDSFYIFYPEKFLSNYHDLLTAFRSIYSKTHIAYSYKTNYMPEICKLVKEEGGWAEVVSEMEYSLASRLGVPSNDIYYNGPYKSDRSLADAVMSGANVNLDSLIEVDKVLALANEFQDRTLRVGLRCNFDIDSGLVSRFGIDTHGEEFSIALDRLKSAGNINLVGLHCHYPYRQLDTFEKRADAMEDLMSKLELPFLEYISFGGGYYGKLPTSLMPGTGKSAPSFQDYADIIAGRMLKMFPAAGPRLIIEPGSALVADAMSLVAKVISTKSVRGRNIATVAASIYNVNPSVKGINRPIKLLHAKSESAHAAEIQKKWDIVGYTCIEDDCLYKEYAGDVHVGDFLMLDNVGSYSIVFKPPFILPSIPVISISHAKKIQLKRAEKFDDVFASFL